MDASSPFHQRVAQHRLFLEHPDIWAAIAPHARAKHYDKDDVIFHHSDPAGHLWLVLSGWLKLSRQTPDGKETIIGLCTQGDILGEATLFPHASYPYHAEAIISDTELALIPGDVLREIVGKNAAFSASIMALLNERVSQAQLKLEHMNTMSSAQRLGCFLLQLCNANAAAGEAATLQIPIEKHLLAAHLGMKPETLSRSQQQLKAASVSIHGAQVHIENLHKLREFVCNSCSESGSCETEATG